MGYTASAHLHLVSSSNYSKPFWLRFHSRQGSLELFPLCESSNQRRFFFSGIAHKSPVTNIYKFQQLAGKHCRKEFWAHSSTQTAREAGQQALSKTLQVTLRKPGAKQKAEQTALTPLNASRWTMQRLFSTVLEIFIKTLTALDRKITWRQHDFLQKPYSEGLC